MSTITTFDLGDGTTAVDEAPQQIITVVDGGVGRDGEGVPVGGSTGQVLAKASGASFDTEWVDQTGGGGGTGAVASVNGHTGVVVLAASDVGADASGAAAAAQTAAVAAADAYTDGKIVAEVARADAAYDAAGAASAALTTAEGYTDTKVAAEVTRANGAFDALGAAAAAQAAAVAASQPLDSDLTAIAALSTTTFGRSLLTQADAAALRTTAGLGTAATQASTAFDATGAAAAAQAASQPLDSDLTAIAALTTTTYGRAFLALADAAAARTALALGTLATQSGTFSGTSSGTNTGDQTITLTGDVTGSGTGSLAATLASTAVTPGSYGDASHSLAATVDAKGRLTALAANSIAIAASQVTSGVLAIGRLATGTPDGTKFVRDDGTLAVPAGGGAAFTTNYAAPSGAAYETFPRQSAPANSPSLTSGTLLLAAINLPAGFVIGHIAFNSSGSGAGTPTHWWFGLYDSSRVQLAVTADQTTTAWNGLTLKSLAIATTAAGAASTFTTTYSGLHYVGIMMAATTTISPKGTACDSTLAALAPVVAGNSDTGQVAPPAFPHTAGSITAGSSIAYAYVGA